MLAQRRTVVVGVSLLVFGGLLGHSDTAEAKNRVAIDFRKAPDAERPGKWTGMGMSNDFIPVDIVACLLGTRVTGKVTHVTSFSFSFSTSENSATVEMTGIINPKGRIVLNGVVTSSTFSSVPVGSRSQLRAQADAMFNVAGTIRLTVP